MSAKGKRKKFLPPDTSEQPDERRFDLDFHYHRRERLSLPTAPKLSTKQGFFRRYRGVLIILADIAILVVLGFVFLRFFGPPDSNARIESYRATVQGLEYGETVFVKVTVRRESGVLSPGAEGRVFVRFSFERKAEDSEAYFDSAALPEEPGSQVVLRAVLPFDKVPERVYAEVRIDERSVLLSFPLEP
jgi:hypothetical protein